MSRSATSVQPQFEPGNLCPLKGEQRTVYKQKRSRHSWALTKSLHLFQMWCFSVTVTHSHVFWISSFQLQPIFFFFLFVFSPWFINHLSVHSIKKNTDLTHVRYFNKSSRLQNIHQRPSDRQPEDLCTSDWCGWWRGRRKTDRGEWDSSPMNDRLQVFGFASQRLRRPLCLLVWSTQAAPFGHDRKKKKKSEGGGRCLTKSEGARSSLQDRPSHCC